MAFLQITILVGFITVFIYYLYVAIANLLFARQHGCRPPRKRHTSDPILGLYYRIQDSRSAKEFRSLPAGLELHREYGETFCESTLFNTVLKTSNTDNIGVIFGSKANAFGVEPFRLPGMRGFCGEGLLTTDGPTWERSRSMIKPSFHRTNIAGMDAFKKSFHEMISRIAKDGSTIDLQPLLSLLVCTNVGLAMFRDLINRL